MNKHDLRHASLALLLALAVNTAWARDDRPEPLPMPKACCEQAIKANQECRAQQAACATPAHKTECCAQACCAAHPACCALQASCCVQGACCAVDPETACREGWMMCGQPEPEAAATGHFTFNIDLNWGKMAHVVVQPTTQAMPTAMPVMQVWTGSQRDRMYQAQATPAPVVNWHAQQTEPRHQYQIQTTVGPRPSILQVIAETQAVAPPVPVAPTMLTGYCFHNLQAPTPSGTLANVRVGYPAHSVPLSQCTACPEPQTILLWSGPPTATGKSHCATCPESHAAPVQKIAQTSATGCSYSVQPAGNQVRITCKHYVALADQMACNDQTGCITLRGHVTIESIPHHGPATQVRADHVVLNPANGRLEVQNASGTALGTTATPPVQPVGYWHFLSK